MFFNFAVYFDFGCCSLAPEISFVDHCQLYFRHRLILHLLSVLLSSSLCLMKICLEISFLLLPPSLVHLQYSSPSAVLVFSSLFIIQVFVLFCFFVCGVEDQSAQGAMLVSPRDGFGNTV
jgi:ABC-type Mn2+/Zn2+ transport system permease subunit